MKSKIKIITNTDHEYGEILQAEPYDSVKIACKSQHQIFRPEKIIRISNGYDYQMKNGDILFAEQIN